MESRAHHRKPAVQPSRVCQPTRVSYWDEWRELDNLRYPRANALAPARFGYDAL